MSILSTSVPIHSRSYSQLYVSKILSLSDSALIYSNTYPPMTILGHSFYLPAYTTEHSRSYAQSDQLKSPIIKHDLHDPYADRLAQVKLNKHVAACLENRTLAAPSKG